MSDFMKVKATAVAAKDGGYPVVLSEKDDAHPDGEAFIGDDQVYEVAPTARVRELIHKGDLVEVSGSGKVSKQLGEGEKELSGAPDKDPKK